MAKKEMACRGVRVGYFKKNWFFFFFRVLIVFVSWSLRLLAHPLPLAAALPAHALEPLAAAAFAAGVLAAAATATAHVHADDPGHRSRRGGLIACCVLLLTTVASVAAGAAADFLARELRRAGLVDRLARPGVIFYLFLFLFCFVLFLVSVLLSCVSLVFGVFVWNKS
jgi:hypothetical protein